MGNLDYAEMHEVTGSSGPAVVLRAVFNRLNRDRLQRPLLFSGNLEKHRVCIDTGLFADNACETRDEWFLPGTYPSPAQGATGEIHIDKPSHGLHMAMDPRIPDE